MTWPTPSQTLQWHWQALHIPPPPPTQPPLCPQKLQLQQCRQPRAAAARGQRTAVGEPLKEPPNRKRSRSDAALGTVLNSRLGDASDRWDPVLPRDPRLESGWRAGVAGAAPARSPPLLVPSPLAVLRAGRSRGPTPLLVTGSSRGDMRLRDRDMEPPRPFCRGPRQPRGTHNLGAAVVVRGPHNPTRHETTHCRPGH